MNETLVSVNESLNSNTLRLEISQSHPNFFTASVKVDSAIVDALYQETSFMQQRHTLTQGFTRGATPLRYIEKTYKNNITAHIEEFLYNYLIKGFLYDELRNKKLIFAGEPKVNTIELSQGNDGLFCFDFTIPESLALRGWKYYSFRPPKRKNYRDLDRQVEFFLRAEEELTQQKMDSHQKTAINDWVCFELGLLNKDKHPILGINNQIFWVKIGNEEVDLPLQELLCDKMVGDQIYSHADVLQSFFSKKIDTHYLFTIIIKDIVSDSVFSVDEFKNKFRLRTNKEMHKKLIEVFSFRNDLSQRREMVEEVFKLLLNQHPVEAPGHLVLRQQNSLMLLIQENPDYRVYRTQENFEKNIHLLAKKQVKEAILIDQLAVKENISLNHQDVKHYFNLLKRPRTKEFLYFDLPPTKTYGQEVPLHEEVLKSYCLREKTLNYVIYHLTRK
jgi:FKBP-type peptidyl-prolyl cis-trans isomerase (trigger factor)